jgi:UDP-glucose 4-epimerase
VKILLTGGNGFIGGRLLPALARRHEVVAVGRVRPDGAHAFIEQDLALPLQTASLPRSIDVVVHLAQSRQYKQFPAGAPDVFAVNVGAAFQLLEYARSAGARRFVLSSTGGIYARAPGPRVETDPVEPSDFYLTSKHVAELLMSNYRQFFQTVVLRPFFVYGPRQRHMLVANLIERVRRREAVTVAGAPGPRINPIFVDDAVAAFEAALEVDGSDVFNVAGEELVSIEELVGLIADIARTDARIEHTAGRSGGDLIGDITRMKSVLGVSPSTPIREGLRLTIEALER